MADISLNIRAMVGAAIISVLFFLSPSTKAAPANAPTGLRCDLMEHPEETVITTAAPEFSWIYRPSLRNDAQTAYRIIVASTEASANSETGDLWDSGLIKSGDSINVPYQGTALQGNADYYWRVQTVDSSGQTSPFSAIQHFRTDAKLFGPPTGNAPADSQFNGLYYNASSDYWANRYPLRFEAAAPVLVTNTAPGQWFIDFGQDAFGYVTVHLNGQYQGTRIQARFGEMASGLAVNTTPPARSFVRYTNTDLTLPGGDIVYPIRPPAFPFPGFAQNKAINPPASYGVVMPFRYFELTNFPGTLTASDVTQERLLDEFDTNAASFESSSPALNQIWNLCRNSMQILTFDGVYVDGDRERTPYESDSYIHQLSAYAVDDEFTLTRYSFEYLLQHPTWPTEWKFHMIFIAWADYQQTGNTDLLYRYYNALKPDLLAWAATGDGLIKGFPGFPQKTNSDVVDWPPADRDGFIIKKGDYLNWTNSINNAFYYRSLQIMSNIATALGRTADAANYDAMAAQVYKSYNAVLWNSHSQSYVDGIGTTHSSAHANFFPLAFGLVPADRQARVIHYLHSRITADKGMPASVYGAQYLLEALFRSGDADMALGLMTTNGPRGWLNMINLGSTVTTEAWSFEDKGNEDWNHAWGAAPGNIISRYVLGVRPVTPGYGEIVIQPHLGTTLSYVRGTVPTIRGPVSLQITNAPGVFEVTANIPGNMTATVMLPTFGETHAAAIVDGQMVPATLSGGWLKVTGIGSGQHSIRLSTNSRPPGVAFIRSNYRLQTLSEKL